MHTIPPSSPYTTEYLLYYNNGCNTSAGFLMRDHLPSGCNS